MKSLCMLKSEKLFNVLTSKKRELILKIPSERLLCPLPHSPPRLLRYNFLGVKAQRLPQSLGHQGVPIPLPTLLRTRLLLSFPPISKPPFVTKKTQGEHHVRENKPDK